VDTVLIGVALVGAVVIVALAFGWQERRRAPEAVAIYGVEDALDFVMARLSEEASAVLGKADVRRILEWEMRYLQDPSLRGDEVAVVGGMEAAQYTQDRALAQGFSYDAAMIIEVLDHQAEYLAGLGAVGDPVDPEESRRIIERYEESG
jgi:hypothetical protein